MYCADVCWTVSVVHNKEEYIQAMEIGTLEWVNLDIRACNKCWCGQLISIHTAVWIKMENNIKTLVQAVLSALWFKNKSLIIVNFNTPKTK